MSPGWNATLAIKREYEARLYEHCGREVNWVDGERAIVDDALGTAG